VDVVLPAGQASAGLAMQWRIMPTKDSPNAGGFIGESVSSQDFAYRTNSIPLLFQSLI
jgi:hypothetical protein